MSNIIAIGKYEKITVFVNKENGKMELSTFLEGKPLKVTLEYFEVKRLIEILKTDKGKRINRLGDVPLNNILLKRICKQYLAYVSGMIKIENLKPTKYDKQSIGEITDEAKGETKEPLGKEPTFEEMMNRPKLEVVPALKDDWDKVIESGGSGLTDLLMKELKIKIDSSDSIQTKRSRAKKVKNPDDIVEIGSLNDIFNNLNKQLNEEETDESITMNDIFANIETQINENQTEEESVLDASDEIVLALMKDAVEKEFEDEEDEDDEDDENANGGGLSFFGK